MKNFGKVCAIVLLLAFNGSPVVSAPADPVSYTRNLWQEYLTAGNDSIKTERLFDLAFYYCDYIGDDRMADSVSQLGVNLAVMSHRPELICMALNRYIESNNLYKNYEKALGYALKAEKLSAAVNPDAASRSCHNLVSVYLAGYEYDKALETSYKALSLAGISDKSTWKAKGYLDVAKSLDGKNQKIEAFRNYLNAISLAERFKNKELLIGCYDRLSNFYNMNRLYDKAMHYKLMQRDLLKEMQPVDSVALMWTQYDLQVIDLNSNNNQLDELSMKKILDFSKRRKHDRMLTDEITLIRTHFIEANKIDRLHDLYYRQFPSELNRLASVNPALYYRIRAYFCEEEHRPDSALLYFRKAEIIINSDPNKVLQSNFYNRFGQFLLRHEMKDLAIEKFTQSYVLASQASYFDFMVKASAELHTLFAIKGDYKSAYHYSVLNKDISDSLNHMAKKDQMLVMEIDHEAWQREQETASENLATERRHYLQYTAMIIIIIGVFIILLMLGSLKVPEWIIRMLGFFSFILLFEFIVLVADHKIHSITHGEPWKILLIKIFLIAILLPMHHWIEKRVVSFLLNPGLINISRYPMGKMLKQLIKR